MGFGGNANVLQMKRTVNSTNPPSSELVSVKVYMMKTNMTPERHRKRIIREAYYWKMACSGDGQWKDRIAPLRGVYLASDSADDFGTPSLVSTWRLDGNLLDYVNKVTFPEESERRRLAMEVVEGLVYLHGLEEQIVHGDLKSCNVLICRDKENVTHVQLIDFGSARQRDVRTGLTSSSTHTTMVYEAPEVARPGSILTVWSDMYAYGLVLLEVIYRVDVNAAFYDVELKLRNLPKNMSKNDKSLVTKLFCDIPKGRPDAVSTLEQLKLGP